MIRWDSLQPLQRLEFTILDAVQGRWERFAEQLPVCNNEHTKLNNSIKLGSYPAHSLFISLYTLIRLTALYRCSYRLSIYLYGMSCFKPAENRSVL